MFHRKPDPNSFEPKSFNIVPPELKPKPQAAAAAAAPPPAANTAPSQGESVIGADLSIEGQTITIRCRGSLRVNGNIEANLHCVELLVGEKAMIKGSIAAERVAVFGRINGAILGANVVLHSTAHVEGDIHSRCLSIEQGASFDGRSRKVTDPAEVAPQLEAVPSASEAQIHSMA